MIKLSSPALSEKIKKHLKLKAQVIADLCVDGKLKKCVQPPQKIGFGQRVVNKFFSFMRHFHIEKDNFSFT